MMNLILNKNIEPIEKELQTKTSILIEKRKIVKDITLDNNLLIEGDNLHTLTILKNQGVKVDVIYIDPPYNTKSREFVYSDSWSNHSDWLEFMKKRLVLARELMTDDAVIYMSIDDREYSYLKILCDIIFGESNYIDTIYWRKCSHKNQSKYLSSVMEQILIYRKSSALKRFNKRSSDPENYRLTDDRGNYRLESLRTCSYGYRKYQDYPITVPDDGSLIFPDSQFAWKRRRKLGVQHGDKCWAISLKTYLQELSEGLIIFKKDKKGQWRVYRKRYARENNVCHSNLFTETACQEASSELKAIFGNKVFDYPKPTTLIKHLLSLYPKQDATVLDFFAGSGTTGQAVLELNNEDNGDRKFILATNNENSICEEITYKRIEAVIRGYTHQLNSKLVEGIPANLIYYKTEFEENLHKATAVA